MLITIDRPFVSLNTTLFSNKMEINSTEQKSCCIPTLFSMCLKQIAQTLCDHPDRFESVMCQLPSSLRETIFVQTLNTQEDRAFAKYEQFFNETDKEDISSVSIETPSYDEICIDDEINDQVHLLKIGIEERLSKYKRKRDETICFL